MSRKTTTNRELAHLNATELEKRREEYKAQLFNLNFQLQTQKLQNVSQLAKVKRNIARINTYLTKLGRS